MNSLFVINTTDLYGRWLARRPCRLTPLGKKGVLLWCKSWLLLGPRLLLVSYSVEPSVYWLARIDVEFQRKLLARCCHFRSRSGEVSVMFHGDTRAIEGVVEGGTSHLLHGLYSLRNFHQFASLLV